MNKELKNWLSYPRWKTMHDKIVDLVLSKGITPKGNDSFGNPEDFLDLSVCSISHTLLKEGMDDPKSWGRSSIKELLSEFGYDVFCGEEYLFEVKYNTWDSELLFTVVKLVGDNKGGYVFQAYNEVEFYDRYGMWGAIQALKLVR